MSSTNERSAKVQIDPVAEARHTYLIEDTHEPHWLCRVVSDGGPGQGHLTLRTPAGIHILYRAKKSTEPTAV